MGVKVVGGTVAGVLSEGRKDFDRVALLCS